MLQPAAALRDAGSSNLSSWAEAHGYRRSSQCDETGTASHDS